MARVFAALPLYYAVALFLYVAGHLMQVLE